MVVVDAMHDLILPSLPTPSSKADGPPPRKPKAGLRWTLKAYSNAVQQGRVHRDCKVYMVP